MAGEVAPRVQVLLSTYNGEGFLREQMDSLLSQDYPNLHILIRDDGSTDGTIDMLQQYKQLPQVTVVCGEHYGVVGSFFHLIDMADPDAAYVAFCDQDDVWLPDKVSEAILCLQKQVPEDVPGLYCSSYTVVDHNLRVLTEAEFPERGPSFANALVQNIAPGCSMVLNRTALNLFVDRIPGPVVPVHDWWFYLVVGGLGQVVYDRRSFLQYRQHGSNHIGAVTGFIHRWTQRLRRFIKGSGLRVATRQAAELQRIYGRMLPESSTLLLEGFLAQRRGIWQRLHYAINTEIYRQNRTDDFILRLLLITNRI